MLPDAHNVAVRDLTPDAWLAFNLMTPSGTIILKKGQWLDKSTIEQWLSRGFHRVLAADSVAPLTQTLDPLAIAETAACTQAAEQRLGELIETLASDAPSSCRDLNPVLAMIAKVAVADRDAALWSVEKDLQTAETTDLQLAKRSAKFSVMSYVTAMALGLCPEECEATAMAALLHDLALYSQSIDYLKRIHSKGIATKHILQQHSLLGAELAASIEGLSEMTRQAMLEVHEQLDGSGYPRGLRGEKISLPGRTLNFVDAYLNLTDANRPDAYVPADAIAYLIKQTVNGAFALPCMQAFLRIASAYGIGTRVMLDDNSLGEVIRSTETDALRPVIRLDDKHGSVIDLRHSSTAIREASLSDTDPRRRIKRSEMDLVLWAPAYFAD